MFDLGSASTLYSCLFDVSIPLSSLFVWRPLGPGFMTFSTHCISCMRGMGIISLGYLSLVSFRFFHPITLTYVTSRILRPPYGHDFTRYAWWLTHGQYLRLVGDYFLEHDKWGVEAMDLHWGIPFLSVMDFQRWYDLHWGIPRSSMVVSFEMMPCIGA